MRRPQEREREDNGCVNTTEHCSFCPETTDVLPCQGNIGHICPNHNLVCQRHSYARDASRLCPECLKSIDVSLQADLTLYRERNGA